MRYLTAVAILAVCVPSTGADDDKAALARMEGSWRVTSIVVGGEPADAGAGAPTSLIIKGEKATFLAEGKEMPTFRDLTLRPDPAKDSKALDIVRGKDMVLPCLYVVSGDEFKLAMPMVPENRKPGELLPRPESFDSKDKPVLVFTMKRIKD